MNIACIPYHDWRKITMEGSRTRDSHIMSHLMANDYIQNLVIINRPISLTELFIKKKNQKIVGELLYKYRGCKLYKLQSNVYLIDFISNDILGPILKKKKWFFDTFDSSSFKEAYEKCLKYLAFNIDIVFSQNIFAAPFVKKMDKSVFDAWDNFILFPENKEIALELKQAYQDYADFSKAWITNSTKNADYYGKHYKPKECLIIKNGVDVESFALKYPKQDDLKRINSPIIGFGGKISHLFDHKLFNHITKIHTDKNFVIVGQILDKGVFNDIAKRKNVYYLGDKHYDIYKSYVTNFDVGIVPYVSDHLEHGADSIKMYEYLASGLSVVGTPGAGMLDMSDYIFIANTHEQFVEYIDKALQIKEKVSLPIEYTWESKTDRIIDLFNAII